MWQHIDSRSIVLPMLYTLGKRFVLVFQVIILSILPNEQCALNFAHFLQQPLMPLRRTFISRRQVSRLPFAGITKSHRHYRHFVHVIEGLVFYSHPTTQSISTRIIPRNSSGMYFSAGCLAYDKNSRFATSPYHRISFRNQAPASLTGFYLPAGRHKD